MDFGGEVHFSSRAAVLLLFGGFWVAVALVALVISVICHPRCTRDATNDGREPVSKNDKCTNEEIHKYTNSKITHNETQQMHDWKKANHKCWSKKCTTAQMTNDWTGQPLKVEQGTSQPGVTRLLVLVAQRTKRWRKELMLVRQQTKDDEQIISLWLRNKQNTRWEELSLIAVCNFYQIQCMLLVLVLLFCELF